MRSNVVLWVLLAAGARVCDAQTKQLTSQDFASAETCRPCHTEIYQQWRSSYHSQSATDPVFWQLFGQAIRDTDSRASALCLACHAPVATVGREVASFGPVSSGLELSPVGREGVTCDFCQTISGQENLGYNISVGAYRLPRKGETAVKYGSHRDALASAHPTQPSGFLRSSEFCGICHKFTHPLPGLDLENTYTEWYYSPYRSQGRRCQDCHMPAYSGTSATDSPERPDISAHVFQGGHTEMLKKAAVVSLWTRTSEKSGRKNIRVDALVTNAGSGHLIPTGIPGIRQLWLDLTVKTAEGAEVFTGRSNYGAVLLDREGRPAMPWNAVRVGSDTRLAPQKSRRETFQFSIPIEKLGILEARARLYYRLVSDQAAKSAGIDPSTPITVAGDRILIFPEGSVRKMPVE